MTGFERDNALLASKLSGVQNQLSNVGDERSSRERGREPPPSPPEAEGVGAGQAERNSSATAQQNVAAQQQATALRVAAQQGHVVATQEKRRVAERRIELISVTVQSVIRAAVSLLTALRTETLVEESH